MPLPIKITFRGMFPTEAIVAHVEKRASRLERFFPRLMACHVILEAPHRHHRGGPTRVSIDMAAQGRELVVSRNPDADREDLYAAIDDAFDDAVRVVEGHFRKRRDLARGMDSIRLNRAS
jgi:ribosomal subunit interface protein